MADVKTLPATAWAVLGLLSFGTPLSGYELRQWALNSLSFFYWTPAQSQIYRELRRLEDEGYVTSTHVAQTDAPDKRVYEPTPAGLAALADWLENAPLEPPVLKHHTALRVFLGHLARPERLGDLLGEHIANVEATLDSLETMSVGLVDDPDADLARAVVDWAMEIHRGDLAGARRLRDRLTG